MGILADENLPQPIMASVKPFSLDIAIFGEVGEDIVAVYQSAVR